MAVVMAKKDWDFSDNEITALRDLAEALEPLELAINQLGSRSMNLVVAECVYQYTSSLFQRLESPIARKLEKSFIHRLNERRNPTLVHLICFLKDPSFWDKEKDFLGHRIQKRHIKKLATDLVKRLFPDDTSYQNPSGLEFDEDGDIELFEDSEKEEPPEMSNAEKLQVRKKAKKHFILMKENLKYIILLQKLCADAFAASDDCSSQKDLQPANVAGEMMKFAQTKYRTPLLTKLFNALKTIPPSSIESERAFSVTGQFITKLRTGLGDDSIDALVFLKTHYKTKENLNQVQNTLTGKNKPEKYIAKSQIQPENPRISKSQPDPQFQTPQASKSQSLAQFSETPQPNKKFKFRSQPPIPFPPQFSDTPRKNNLSTNPDEIQMLEDSE